MEVHEGQSGPIRMVLAFDLITRSFWSWTYSGSLGPCKARGLNGATNQRIKRQIPPCGVIEAFLLVRASSGLVVIIAKWSLMTRSGVIYPYLLSQGTNSAV